MQRPIAYEDDKKDKHDIHNVKNHIHTTTPNAAFDFMQGFC